MKMKQIVLIISTTILILLFLGLFEYVGSSNAKIRHTTKIMVELELAYTSDKIRNDGKLVELEKLISGNMKDAWDRGMMIKEENQKIEVHSAGSDGLFGTSDDIIWSNK